MSRPEDRDLTGRPSSGPAPLPPRDEDLPEPLLPDQPREADRPVPLRAAPERTHDPRDWDVDGREPIEPAPTPSASEDPPDAGRDLADELPPWIDGDSSYSTELQQGSVHPRPTSVDDDHDDEGTEG